MKTTVLFSMLLTLSVSCGIAQTGITDVEPDGQYFIVDVREPWSSTGLLVPTGDSVEIMAWGLASAVSSPVIWHGPAGPGSSPADGNFPVSEGAAYSLIGRLGARDPFIIGDGRVFRNDGGADSLFIGFNDVVSYADNQGYFVVHISVTGSPVVAVDEGPDRAPAEFTLGQNYPNPFNPVTSIGYSIPKAAHVRLVVCNLLGQELSVLVDGYQEGGQHEVIFDATGLPSVTYFYRLTAGDLTSYRKMVVLK